MAETIQDGTGSGFSMKVDEKGRAHVDSVTTQREEAQSQRGFAFNVNTGNITLTNGATKNAVLYIKNNEDYDLIITNIFYILGNTTSGTGNCYLEIVRNPTTGTIISGATAVSINQNKNFGSSRALSVTAYKGATGLTFTNGDDYAATILNAGPQRIVITGGSITLPKGASIGINYTTPTSNTSQIVQFAMSCYLEDESTQYK